jgi:hypothetical protein
MSLPAGVMDELEPQFQLIHVIVEGIELRSISSMVAASSSIG